MIGGLVPSALCWWAGLDKDQLIADCICGYRKARTGISRKYGEKA